MILKMLNIDNKKTESSPVDKKCYSFVFLSFLLLVFTNNIKLEAGRTNLQMVLSPDIFYWVA